ncbi:unnamed protein product [Amoebophrya sp. A25]|nr:unnamed protein product [Amoebophrya sp. A25]|eukprot:GSA25T00020012001.1
MGLCADKDIFLAALAGTRTQNESEEVAKDLFEYYTSQETRSDEAFVLDAIETFPATATGFGGYGFDASLQRDKGLIRAVFQQSSAGSTARKIINYMSEEQKKDHTKICGWYGQKVGAERIRYDLVDGEQEPKSQDQGLWHGHY